MCTIPLKYAAPRPAVVPQPCPAVAVASPLLSPRLLYYAGSVPMQELSHTWEVG